MKETIRKIVGESIDVKKCLCKDQAANIEKAARAIIGSIESGGTLLVFGNGGSAADSQHIVAELVGRFKKERRALPAIALTTNTSTLTAIANDYGYDLTFARQLEAIARPRDIVMAISTSGNSKNVVSAVRKARSMGLATIGITGAGGGRLKKECGVSIVVGSKDTARIQESHLTVIHILCELIEDRFFNARTDR